LVARHVRAWNSTNALLPDELAVTTIRCRQIGEPLPPEVREVITVMVQVALRAWRERLRLMEEPGC
jgi:hypothetical protein